MGFWGDDQKMISYHALDERCIGLFGMKESASHKGRC